MAEKLLPDLFPNATQTADEIIIPKSDLGLSALPSHTADQIIAAIVIQTKSVLTQANFDSEFNQSLYLRNGFDGLTTKNDGTNDVRFIVEEIVVSLAKPIANSTMNPEDY